MTTLAKWPIGSEFVTAYWPRRGRLVSRTPSSAVVTWLDAPKAKTITCHDDEGNVVERTIRVGPQTERIALGTEIEEAKR